MCYIVNSIVAPAKFSNLLDSETWCTDPHLVHEVVFAAKKITYLDMINGSGSLT